MKLALLRTWYARIRTRLPAGVQRTIRRRYYRGVVRNYRASDWEWTPVVRALVPEGGQVLDVGANVGYLTGLFARWVGPSGKVVAVEPIPDTYDVLSSSMRALFPGRVVAVPCCVSDQPGLVTMEVPVGSDGRENFYESRITAGAQPTPGRLRYQVAAKTLPAIAAEHGITPDFIKIDVEGHEDTVIRGASALLAAHQPPLLIEVSGDPDQAGSSAAALFARLAAHGYRALVLENGACRERRRGDVAVDYLFVAGETAKKGLGARAVNG